MVFGVGRRGEAHALLVLAAIQRQLGAVAVQRFAEAGDIAMAEDREAAAAQACLLTVDFDELIGKVPDDGLRRCEADGVLRICHVNTGPLGNFPHQAGCSLRVSVFCSYKICNRLQSSFRL